MFLTRLKVYLSPQLLKKRERLKEKEEKCGRGMLQCVKCEFRYFILKETRYEKEWSTVTCYNMGEPQNYAPKRWQEPDTVWFLLHEIYRISKSIETQRRLVDSRGWRWGWGMRKDYLRGTKKFWNQRKNTVNAQNASESYTLKWLIVCYMNFTSIFKK